MSHTSRRDFLRYASSTVCTPLLAGLTRAGLAAEDQGADRRRLVLMFSPNGTLPDRFWPDEEGPEFKLKEIVTPLEPFHDRTLFLKGISNKVRGDGDGHMRGMSCLLTGIELFPGNIQGGSDTPAGWPRGISIDQKIKNFLQSDRRTRTRFGSLEFGVLVPHRADPWTRWVYAGPKQPVAPIDDPYNMFQRMYGRLDDQESLNSILDDVADDLRSLTSLVSGEDRQRLERHLTFVRQTEGELKTARQTAHVMSPPVLPPGVALKNDNMPRISQMQMELLVSGFASDQCRVATLQFTNSVGNARMSWLGIDENHHALSHDPDLNVASQEKLTKINKWFCEQMAYLLRRLEETPEPRGDGSLLDHTMVVWTNELGKGNSHALNNIPFVAVGGRQWPWRMGRSLRLDNVPHNRLLMSLAHGMGHPIATFGNPVLSQDGPLDLS